MSDKDEIIAAIREGFSSVGSNTNGSRSYSGGGGANLDTLATSAGSLTGQLAVFAATAGKLGLGTALLAEGFLQLANAGRTLVDNWRTASDTGLNFGSNIIGYNAALTRAQLTQQDLDKIYKVAGVNLMNFGAGMEGGTRDFLRLSHEYQSSGVIDQVRLLGFSTEQANEVMAIQQASATTYNNRKRLSDEEVFRRTQEMAKEFAAVTDASGMSRKKQLEIIQKQMEDESLQLAFDNAGGAVKDGFTKISSDMGSRGVETLAKSIMSGNITEKVGEQLSVLGAPGQQFKFALENYAEILKNHAVNSKEALAAEKEVRIANAAVTDLTRTQQFRDIAQHEAMYTQAGSNVGKIALELSAQNRAIRFNAKPGEILDQTTARLAEEKKAFIPDPKAEEAQKKLSEGMLLVGRVADNIEINSATALLTAATMAGGLLVRFKGDALSGLRARDANGKAGAFTPEAAEGAGNKIANAVNNIFSEVSKALPEDLKKRATEMSNATADWMSNAWKIAMEKLPAVRQTIENLTKDINPRSQGSPGVADFLSGSNFNSIFENFGSGTLATLHGMEAVVRPEQLSGIINKATAQASSALPIMANQMTQATSQFNQVNPEVFNDIKSQLAMLNSLMASHLPDISSTMTKQYSAMRDLSPDFHA
jgi:hypothetical protein